MKKKPVQPQEVQRVVLRALVDSFQGRVLTWEVATHGLSLAAFEIKNTALRQIAARR